MTESASQRRRRPAAGGYARGEETRERIVEAALKVFGEEGYLRASTRRIADAAGVHPPALQYYFDGKEGLHRACAERILAAAAPLQEAFAAAERRLACDGRAAAAPALCDVMDALVDLSLEHKADPGRANFVTRAQADGEGPALPMIRDQLVLPMQETFARLVAAALGGAADDLTIRLRASFLIAQASALGARRENTLQFLKLKDFDGQREQIKRVLREHTLAALTAAASAP
jgi:TetR/AcrR family transcriptional regulator, regulator of cefoperazone and chloramphenicol sensitivity